jgi:hypothetical protein
MAKILIQVEPAGDTPPTVTYRWDPDTEILSAQVSPRLPGEGMDGSVELEGSDGSWLILDIASGRINGVEVAVWPEVQMRGALKPPAKIEEGRVLVPARRSTPDLASLEVETAVRAEADSDETVFHFSIGKTRQTRAIRLARDLLLELDASNNLAGLWLLNVPPFRARV